MSKIIVVVLSSLLVSFADAESAFRNDVSRREAAQDALKPFAGRVGAWKGTGQPQRSSAKGAWLESADWSWALTADSAALALKVEKGKYLKSALLKPDAKAGAFVLDVVLADGSRRTFSGTATAGSTGKLVMTSIDARAEGLSRVTFTALHDTRFLMLLESRAADSERYQRLAEIGYTRQGVVFAAGDSYPVCIVTGGRGTTQVSFEGKTYWVCCSGCKDLFNDDPKSVLAEAEAKRKAKANK